ncbi:MAG: hypothetical protein GVY24_08020 [Planctomycetes bacterium]|jgi:predicted MPP superfamily phosphohydrolase|nr:hypothetical protein [Planctomycetota bacterium]
MPATRSLLEPLDLMLPALPQGLNGLRLAHLSDLHVRKTDRRFDRLLSRLAASRLDLLLLTGDYQDRSAPPEAALALLERLATEVKPTLGLFGIWGNHDSAELREASLDLPICGGIHDEDADSVPLAMSVAALEDQAEAGEKPASRLRLLLAHHPHQLVTAADLGADLMFCGHTHGGQIRIPPGIPVHHGSDLPLNMAAGLLRCRDTLGVISRGLGESHLRLRLACPRQAIVCTLRTGPRPGARTDGIDLIRAW